MNKSFKEWDEIAKTIEDDEEENTSMTTSQYCNNIMNMMKATLPLVNKQNLPKDFATIHEKNLKESLFGHTGMMRDKLEKLSSISALVHDRTRQETGKKGQ